MELGVIDGQQTAIGSGLSAAVNRLRELKSKSRIVILMTDGQNNAGSIPPITAAEAAASLGVKVYTIGVGTRGYAPVPAKDAFGRKVYVRQAVDIDEDTLRKVAEKTGSTGQMVFVTVRHEVAGAAGPAITEEQDIVYVAMPDRCWRGPASTGLCADLLLQLLLVCVCAPGPGLRPGSWCI